MSALASRLPVALDALMADAKRRASRHRVLLGVVALALIGGAALYATTFTSSGTRPTGSAALSGLTISTHFGSNPWGSHGKRITLDQLVAEAPYIPLPDSPLANSRNVGTVWVWEEPQMNRVAAAVYYPSSGIELLWAGTGVDYTGSTPEENQMIDGVHALVLARDNPSGVSSVLLPVAPDHLLTMEGFVPANDLVSVAKTLNPSPASGA